MSDDDRRSLDPYDIAYGSLEGITGVTMTKATTLRTTMPIIGGVATYIVQTARKKDEQEKSPAEFWVFVEFADKDTHHRFVIPPAVAEAIARQRDALTGRARVKAAKAGAKTRADRGIQPGFLKNKKTKKGPKHDGD